MIRNQDIKSRSVLSTIAVGLAVLATASSSSFDAQSRAAAKPAAVPAVTAEQALPMTCAQAWEASHKTYPQMLAIVTTLAKVSLANRDLTLPNTREVGVEAGRGIADDCKADPEALLYAIVDKQVRRFAESTKR